MQRGRTSTASKAEGQQVSQEVVPRETGETEKKDRMRMRSLTFVPSASGKSLHVLLKNALSL